jgi:hypothetical protein
MDLRLAGGRFTDVLPCFQSAPYDEARRDRLRAVSPTHLTLASHTTRVDAFAEDPTKAVILEIDATDADAALTLELRSPMKATITTPLRELQRDNRIHFTGPFTSECLLLERLVGPSECTATLRWHDRRPGRKEADWYYVRVQQHNNQMAWSSPIWVG